MKKRDAAPARPIFCDLSGCAHLAGRSIPPGNDMTYAKGRAPWTE